jgi:putrescine transport system permease protein
VTARTPRLLFAALAFGYAFLYVPILSMIVYAFNESRLVTVWAGFSLKWWGELLRNDAMLDAAFLSLRIALVNACVATVLGTMAGFALARYPRFAGRTAFAGLMAAPLVMPEVIMGIATLLLFVALEQAFGWPERGAGTITIAHITFSAAFVAVVIQARLADFDRSVEEAAMDLGARPFTVFRTITLPLIAPSLVAGWLLAFTLSMDDLILTQFVAGPQSQTLPMLIYSSVRLGVSPQINVLATIIVTVVATAIILSGWLMNRSQRRRAREARAAARA